MALSFHQAPTPLSAMSLLRRNFLSMAGGAFSTIALAALESSARGDSSPLDPTRPLAPREPDRIATARQVIVIFLVGGPSQIDTFDHKPHLDSLDGQSVPESLRKAVEATKFANVFHGCEDKLMKSPYRFERYGEMGIAVSELHPHLAKHVDKMCFLHSLQSDSNNHAPSSYQLHTGDIRPGKASLGSWVTYGLGSENQELPGYVVLFDAGPLGGAANYVNGFLPAAFQPTRLRDHGTPVLDLLPPETFAAGQRDSFALLEQLNRAHRESRLATSELDARIAAYELAYRMQSSALEVGNLADEPQWLLDAYGVSDPEARASSFARKCLMARRLVERGVRFVQIYDMPDKDGWDAHGDLAGNHTPRARWTDRPAAELLADLERRGLLDSTLVLWISEFGRTPMMQGDRGRQHNAAGFTCWMAGGGVQPGRIGATDEIGLMAIERPIPIRDLHATLLQALGLDFEKLSFRVAGRDERLTGVAGRARPVEGVLRG